MGYIESTWDRRTCAGLAKTKRFVCFKLCESVWSFFAEPTVTRIIIWTFLKTLLCLSYSNILTEISFFNKMGQPPPCTSLARALPTDYLVCTSYLNRRVVARIERGGTIAWSPRSPHNTPGLLCVGIR